MFLFYLHFFISYLTEKNGLLIQSHIDTAVRLAAGWIDMGNRSNFISCQTERILLSVIFSFIILTRELLFLFYLVDVSGKYNSLKYQGIIFYVISNYQTSYNTREFDSIILLLIYHSLYYQYFSFTKNYRETILL